MSNQDKKINLAVHKNRPQTLAAVFGGFMELLGGRTADADLAKNWDNIVGKDISNIAKVVAIKKTRDKKLNVILRPVSSAFALELSYKKEECKTKINKYYGRDAVDKIIIRK